MNQHGQSGDMPKSPNSEEFAAVLKERSEQDSRRTDEPKPSGIYLIGSPTIPGTTIHLADEKDFRIVARNVSSTNEYVAGAELNGKPLGRAWLRHREIVNGGELILRMAVRASRWDADEEPPPSPGALN